MTVRFTGRISAVNPRGSSGVVVLDEPADGLDLAVINDSTRGRLALMNAEPSGRIPSGLRVQGMGRPGPDALLALEIEPLLKPPHPPSA